MWQLVVTPDTDWISDPPIQEPPPKDISMHLDAPHFTMKGTTLIEQFRFSILMGF